MELNNLKDSLYGGIVVHHDIKNLYIHSDEWDLDIMTEYWMLSPYDNNNWLTFSPVSVHCTVQWIKKLGIEGGTVPKRVTTFNYLKRPYKAIRLSRDNNEHKMNAVATIDAYRRFPQVLVREHGKNYVYILHWVDNVARYSNALCPSSSILAPADMYESVTFCASIQNIGRIPYDSVSTWYVIGSNYDYGDALSYELRTTNISLPDPPLLDTFWQGAKNYILKPAASALVGFLTGDPAGAAVTGATHIAHQLVANLTTPKETSKATEAKRN